jgi:hypothetical protein
VDPTTVRVDPTTVAAGSTTAATVTSPEVRLKANPTTVAAVTAEEIVMLPDAPPPIDVAGLDVASIDIVRPEIESLALAPALAVDDMTIATLEDVALNQ